MTAPVTIVSCLYGDRGYDRFIAEWQHSIRQLETRPNAVVVAADKAYDIPCAYVFVMDCPWRHPQAFYLDRAVSLALTEWVWVLDIDDLALPDALNGIDQIHADVWQMGYIGPDGEPRLPPRITAPEYLALDGNPFVGGSAFRVDAYRHAGGFADVAFQDWGLWRRMAAAGATFDASDRPHFRYRRHPDSRTGTELMPHRRRAHIEEMLAS